MPTILQTLAVIAMVAVAVVLTFGLWNMLKDGGTGRSQKLMRLRVITQAVAVVLVVAAIYFSR